MAKLKNELLSPCGLYCGVCAVYVAHISDDNDFKERLLPVFEKWGANTIEDIACTGCLSDDVVFPFCQTCTIKNCVIEKHLEGCHQCDEFPCEILEQWPSPEGRDVMLKEIPKWRELGTEKWIDNIEKRNKCPECGIINYRGANKCFKCQTPIINQ